MPKQNLNLDTPNSENGDSLRDGGNKINQNFDELYYRFCDIPCPAGIWAPDTTNPPAASTIDYSGLAIDVYDFDAATEESIYMTWRLPQDYGGGAIKWVVDFDGASGCTGTSVFGFSAGVRFSGSPVGLNLGAERVLTGSYIDEASGVYYTTPYDDVGITLAGTPTGGALATFKLAVKTDGTTTVDTRFINLTMQYASVSGEFPSEWSN